MNCNAKRILLNLSTKLCEVLPVFFWAFLIFGFEEAEVAITTIICALIHECGHLWCILFQNGSASLGGVIFGFRIKAKKLKSYNQEISVYLCGPLANLVIAFVFYLLTPNLGEPAITVATLNLATALSNLLPIKGYDGYGILRAVIMKSGHHDRLMVIIDYLSSLLTFLLCIFSLYLVDRQGGGYWIFALFFFSMIKSIRSDLGE